MVCGVFAKTVDKGLWSCQVKPAKAELAAARRVQENIVASGKLEIAEKALQQRTA